MDAENNKASLQETYEHLKEIQKEMQSKIDELTEAIKNNPGLSLNANTTEDDIIEKRLRFYASLKKLILKENPKNYPLPASEDIHVTAVKNLEKEVSNSSALVDDMNKELSRLKTEVS